MSDSTIKLSALATGVAAALGSTPQAAAQDDTIEEVIVTGSHIRRTGFEGRAPIQVVDAETIAQLGVNQPVEVLKDLTVNNGSQLYNETNARAGVSQFNIRNLGLGSSLTLLNGRRAGIAAVADDTGQDFVDMNQFPLAMIERIEVLTDGASATYGSQAVAGVVNIITRKGFEGFEISGGGSWSEIPTRDLNLALGHQFDRGGFNFYATYYTQGNQDRSDFDWMHERLIGTPVVGDARLSRFVSSTGSPGSYVRATLNADGEAEDVEIPDPANPGEFISAGRNPDPDCLAAGGILRSPTDSSCRYNFVDQVSVISGEERVQTFTEFDWEFTDSLKYYAEASYSHNIIRRSDGGGTLNTGNAVGGGVTILPSHPFNFFIEDPADPLGLLWVDPATWDPAVNTAATVRMIGRPLGIDVNHNENTQKIRRTQDYIRFVQGMEFDFQNSWFIDASFTFNRATRITDDAHNYRSDLWQNLIRTGEWNPFGSRLANPGLVSPKDPADTAECAGVRANSVCTAGNPQVTQDKFDQRSVTTSRTRQHVVDLVASGELFEFGNNTVSAAIGAQYRDSVFETVPDSLGAAGEANEESISSFISGSEDVWAVFGEVIVPFGDDIELQLALRQEDYGGSIGSTTDPKVSFEWMPLEGLGIRGSWGTSFQAPTVRQTATATSSAFIDDPASPTGPGGSLQCVSTGLNNNITVNVIGSPDLTPTESENFTIGVVFQSDAFRASLDYWNFDYEDLIAQSEGAQAIVDLDCAAPPIGDGIPNDPRVIRDAGGQLRQVNTEFINVGRVETDGFDLVTDYVFDVGNSQLILDATATYVLGFDVDTDGDGNTDFDGVGSRNFTNSFSTMPELRAHGGVTWLFGNQSANLTLRYIDSYTNDQSTAGAPAEVDSWTTLDAQYSIVFPGLIGDGDTTISVGANNILDEEPPALVRNFSDGTQRPPQNPSTGIFDGVDRPGYDDRAGHDIRGQILYARFVQQF